LSKTGFLSHNFGSRYATKSTMRSKDTDHSLVSKKRLSQKNGTLGCRPGLGKIDQISKTSPNITARKLFQSELEDLLNP